MKAQVGEGTLLVTEVPGLPALSHEEGMGPSQSPDGTGMGWW